MDSVGKILNDKSFFPQTPGIAAGKAPVIGTILSDLYQVGFYVATFVALFWLSWGIFEYIFAGGDKQRLGSARKRITWAIVGLIFVLVAFLIAQFAAQIIVAPDRAKTLPIF